MREILIKNPEILERLAGFTARFLELDHRNLNIENRDPKIDADYGTSREYLDHMMKKGHKGFPEAIRGIDINFSHTSLTEDWKKLNHEMSNEFTRELGCQQNALCCYYPPEGFIGWHDNHDVPGHTLLFNWSEDGSGFYRYRDCDTGEMVTIKDKVGWSSKTGTYGDGKEFPRQWHSAKAGCHRWSIAFYIRNLEMLEMIVEDIECSDG